MSSPVHICDVIKQNQSEVGHIQFSVSYLKINISDFRLILLDHITYHHCCYTNLTFSAMNCYAKLKLVALFLYNLFSLCATHTGLDLYFSGTIVSRAGNFEKLQAQS